MAKLKGSKKSGGRKAGTPNKDKKELLDRIKEKFPNYCPVEAMCLVGMDVCEKPELRMMAHKEVAQYIYPKLKSIDHNHGGQQDNPINMNMQVEFIKGNA